MLHFVRHRESIIPDDEGVEEIGISAINKPGITELIIPEGIKRLRPLDFYYVTSIKVEKDGGKSIVDDHISLKKISFPSTLEEVFFKSYDWNIKDVDEITVSQKNSVFDSRNDCNALIDTKENRLILACKNTVIPEGVVSIDGRLIANETIDKLVIPKSVKRFASLSLSGKKINELIFLGDDIVFGYEDRDYNPLSTRNPSCNKIIASKTILKKCKEILEEAGLHTELIELK